MEQKPKPCVNRREPVHFAENLWIRVEQMRQLHPTVLDIEDIPETYACDLRPPHADRPWVVLNMVTSIDGATAVDGLSGGLGGVGDAQVFRAIRAVADVIVVGSGTATAENYGPPVLSPELIERRTSRGQAELPAIAVLSNSLSLDPTQRLFTSNTFRPIIATSHAAPPGPLHELQAVADIVQKGETSTDLVATLGHLHSLGHRVALLEGGPSINAQFIALDLVDELTLTFSPTLVGGTSKRLAVGPDAVAANMSLDRIIEADDHLFLRYVRNRHN